MTHNTALTSFAQTDIHDSALNLVDALLTRIEAARTPEKVAENDHLMKCSSSSTVYLPFIDTVWKVPCVLS